MTDKSLLWITFFLINSIFSFGSSLHSDEAIKSPSDLNKDKQNLDSQKVILKGYLIHEPGAYAIWDNKELKEKGDVSGCVSLLYPSSLRKEIVSANQRNVTLKGIFRRDVTKDRGVFLGLCNYTGIVVSEVIDVQK